VLLSTKLSPDDGEKSFVVALSEQFISKNGLSMHVLF
jgi:hypothetical protein